jgi:hypothetical protein
MIDYLNPLEIGEIHPLPDRVLRAWVRQSAEATAGPRPGGPAG